MQIQVHSDNHIESSARLINWVSTTVNSQLERYDEELTRVVVHFSDENGHKAGDSDKRCQIEARAKGRQPVSVTSHAASLEFALDGAMDKLSHALEHQIGKLRDRRALGVGNEIGRRSERDRLMEEEFLEEQQLRSA